MSKKIIKVYIACFVVVFVSTILSISSRQANAAIVPESCYVFDAATNTITDYNPLNDQVCTEDPEIPSSISGVDVHAIGYNAFGHKNLKSVVIPNSVTEIGTNSFWHNQLASVVIPNSVTTIRTEAFRYNKLTTLSISDSVTYIGTRSFADNELTILNIPPSLTDIDANAFSNNLLTSVTIPDTVSVIAEGVFSNNKLKSVYIPNSVTTIQKFAFMSNQLTSVTLPDSITSIEEATFALNKITSVTIPNSVIAVDLMAFYAQNPLGGDADVVSQSGINSLTETIFYTRLYTQDSSNPHDLDDGIFTEAIMNQDVNQDGDLNDSLGGHLINPTFAKVSFVNSADGSKIISDQMHTGDGLYDYLAASNASNNSNLYFRIGQVRQFIAPSFDNYSLSGPSSPYDMLLNSTDNNLEFMYTPISSNVVNLEKNQTKNNVLASTGQNLIKLIIISVILTSVTLFYILFKFKYNSYKVN